MPKGMTYATQAEREAAILETKRRYREKNREIENQKARERNREKARVLRDANPRPPKRTREEHLARRMELRAAKPTETKQEEHFRYNIAKYGLSVQDYERMWEDQHGRCPICLVGLVRGRAAAGAAVDHCHETGQVRGLLCRLCNRALGELRDDPVAFDRAAKYLRDSIAKR